MKLELQNRRQKITRIRSVGCDVVFRTGIESLFAARRGRRPSLILLAQIPPGLVVVVRTDFTRENFPPPLIYQVTERQEGDLVERSIQEETNIGALVRRLVDQANLF